jgi:tRNA pseudouridine38-40 synthase
MWRTIQLVIAYDGTDFHGWQDQPGRPTVQAAIEQAARRVLKHPLDVVGAGRTDAGVHALGQVAHLRTSTDIPPGNLVRAISGRIPESISIIRARHVHPDFHATTTSLSKQYRYRIHNRSNKPADNHAHRFTYHCWTPLDVDLMRIAAQAFVGKHDFSSMASANKPRPTYVRTVLRVNVYRCYDEIIVEVEGTGFLYHQVRNMVGTLVEVGRGHWPPEKVADILASKDRSRAGPTLPPKGLCMTWVKYPPHLLRVPAVPKTDPATETS